MLDEICKKGCEAMKKILAILLVVVLLLTGVGCSVSNTGKAPAVGAEGEVYTDFPGVEVRIKEMHIEDGKTVLTVVWSNQTEYNVLYGEPYAIERLVNGQWVSASKHVENATFTAIGYMLHTGQEQTKGYAVSWIFDVSAPGTYRFKTSCSVEAPETARKECTMWAVFTVGDGRQTVGGAQYRAQYIRTDGDYGGSYRKAEIIDSLQALQDYYTDYREKFDLERKEKVYADTTIGFLDACDGYDEAFFEKNYLVFVRLQEGSGSIRHQVMGVEQTEEQKLSIYINRDIPEVCTDDMAYWHIILELSRDLLVTSSDDISVYV